MWFALSKGRMVLLQKLVFPFFIEAILLLFLLLQPVCSSSQHHIITSNQDSTHNKPSSKLVFEITVHGFLLWASMGFLMPIGILAIRMSNREECGRRLKILFYVHAILQIVSALLATIAAIMSIKNFNNAFDNNHQRIGVSLYGLIWCQSLIGLIRPRRGSSRRNIWYFVHWLLGTVVLVLGIFNIYTGLTAYQAKTSRSIRLWTLIFTAQISFFALLYLLQDKWEYMRKQGVILGDDLIVRPADHDGVVAHREDHEKHNKLKAGSC